MTAQIPDMVRFRKRQWELIGVDGEEELFDPAKSGLAPVSPHTACWRGFHCLFAIGWGELYLSGLTVWTLDDERPWLGGVEPEVPRGEHPEFPDFPTMLVYGRLHLPLAYSGQLRLAHGFHWDRYEHMGFQAPYAYDSVMDLRFEQAKLVGECDRSHDLGYAASQGAGQPPDRVDVVAWIDDRFARRM